MQFCQYFITKGLFLKEHEQWEFEANNSFSINSMKFINQTPDAIVLLCSHFVFGKQTHCKDLSQGFESGLLKL